VDAITLTDVPTRTAQAFARTLVDAITLAEAITRSRGTLGIAVDHITLTDVVTRTRGFNRFPTESLTLTDIAVRLVALVPRTTVDTLTIADVLVSVGPPTIRGSVETGGSIVGADTGGGIAGLIESGGGIYGLP
jgi:hypothetical protein